MLECSLIKGVIDMVKKKRKTLTNKHNFLTLSLTAMTGQPKDIHPIITLTELI